MGLLTILKKLKQKEKEMRLLILGLDNAGKPVNFINVLMAAVAGIHSAGRGARSSLLRARLPFH